MIIITPPCHGAAGKTKDERIYKYINNEKYDTEYENSVLKHPIIQIYLIIFNYLYIPFYSARNNSQKKNIGAKHFTLCYPLFFLSHYVLFLVFSLIYLLI
ncbi:hypothetical protein, unlikely [Trypanosoma brucei gambiense DAL972]|uniref:Uncharacterized protein n=1 Tax=Trypanosoma brucei gambiense (strain MHOM/CI/86/DAL972) TaxID=679716 RepID=C9ZM92_TRYB9|nr:hypothetical protein, unlikely [Trypanosoma brucei gambiense DAL972]CBH10765.1 hypothetical protein, unlikely [Trypanosoma brucei gambiense DAL972]|eukprot:XP_011773053.1 hypothetical protein, unlikely [Trypanosoma brucei gambiense DAL972]